MSYHSSIVGGSTAGRVIACPASVQACLALPPSADVTSEYAEEGTAMHAVMEKLMRVRWETRTSIGGLITMAGSWIGQRFYDRDLTREHCDTMIFPALVALGELEDAHENYGGPFNVVRVERKVSFPKIMDAFGTIDLIEANKHALLHVDWKFGAGVPVSATYPNGQINPQLMYYVTASRYTEPMLYHGVDRLIAAIIQPRSATPLSSVEIKKADIRNFRTLLESSVRLALQPRPMRQRGEHCRFAPCKLTCPEWTGPLINLEKLQGFKVPASAPAPQVTPFGQYLAHAKMLADFGAMFKAEVDEQLHAYLVAGGIVPGWKLKAKTKLRRWVDDATVEAALRKLGFKLDEIYQKKLVTFQSADATAKRRNVKIPDTLRVAPPSDETTIAPESDPAPAVVRATLTEQFQASLKALAAPGGA